jgi:hypothetical protein
VPWPIDLGIWHQSEAEAEKFESCSLSRAPTSNQAIQTVSELQVEPGQKSASDAQSQHRVVRDRRTTAVVSAESVTRRSWLSRFRTHDC